MSKPSKTPLLDQIHTPDDLRRLDESQLRQVADELRTGDDRRGRRSPAAISAPASAWSS